MKGGGDNQLDGDDGLTALVNSETKHLGLDQNVSGKKSLTVSNR